MKTIDLWEDIEEYHEWVCPYVKCRNVNNEHGEVHYSPGDTVTCRKCKRTIKVTSNYD